ncbi:MAG: hypothetical protein ABSB19_06540 [Methylomonas sp.]|jgi:hypothetical protein
MKFFLACLLAVFATVFALTAAASANKLKPGQKSTTCYYNSGPKVGHTESLSGKAMPVLIGRPCSDGEGSAGLAVLDKEDEEAEAAEEAAKDEALQKEILRQQGKTP